MSNEIKKVNTSSGLISLDSATGDIDISNLSPEAQDELRKYAAMKKIDLKAAVQETQRDLQATSIAVGNMADATRRMSESGDAVTIRQTINNKAGQTEVLMGNTNEAKRGNVDKDTSTWAYVVGGIVVLLIVAAVLGG